MRPRSIAICLFLLLIAPRAWGQGVSSAPDFTTGLWTRSNLLGDAGGLRSALWNYGVTIGLQAIDEVWGNVSGGIKRGASYDGVTLISIGLDTQRAFGWSGGPFNISVWNIRGRSISADNLLNLQTVSGILATPTTRIWEAWFQQSFLDGMKLGQQSLDQEFMNSQGSGLFLNTMMGPAYPLSSLGVRLRGLLPGGFTVLGGVFQDNPPGGPFNADSQLPGSTRWGGNFNLRTGASFIAEVQYVLNQPSNGEMDYDGRASRLPGTYKLGAWIDTAPFPSQRFDNGGLSLADPASDGLPRMLRNNASIYGVVDQMIWRPAEDSPRSLPVFACLMGAPDDRNLISFSVNAGIVLKAPLPGRDNDSVGAGFGIAKVSAAVAGFDSDTAVFSGSPVPIRGSETFIELTCQCQVAGWWQLQPDFQYVLNPGGGILDPNDPSQRVGNEAIFGLRSAVTF